MHVIRWSINFPAETEFEGQAIRDTPGVLDVRRKGPPAHSESSVQDIPVDAIRDAERKVSQCRLRSRSVHLARELSVEIVCAASGECREAVEPVPQKQSAELDVM